MCVGVCRSLPLCFTARMCIHRLLNALAVAPVPPRSLRSVGNAQGSRCRARILRGGFVERSPPGISLCDSSAGRSHLLSLVLFLDYFQKKKTWRWMFGSRGEKSRARVFTTGSSISSSAPQTTQIDLFYTLFQKPQCL